MRRTFVRDPAQVSVQRLVQVEVELLQRFPDALVHQIRKRVRVWHLHSRRLEVKRLALLRGTIPISDDQNLR